MRCTTLNECESGCGCDGRGWGDGSGDGALRSELADAEGGEEGDDVGRVVVCKHGGTIDEGSDGYRILDLQWGVRIRGGLSVVPKRWVVAEISARGQVKNYAE